MILSEFLSEFKVSQDEVISSLDTSIHGELLQINNELYFVSHELIALKKEIEKNSGITPASFGVFIGRILKREFIPGVKLLDVLSEKTSNKIVLNKKTSWLYICGRDVFGKSIVKGSFPVNTYVLVLDEEENVLGYGKVILPMTNQNAEKVVIENLFDKGDFLRREREKRK